ncbi:MAG: hypothetical protein IE909_17355 [Campylobacterales bacterium]|nr:hypothetical protein [Campylobacterales bacterium]
MLVAVYFIFECFSVFRRIDYFAFALIFVFSVNSLINFAHGSGVPAFSFVEHFKADNINENLGPNPYRNSFLSSSGYFSAGTAYAIAFLFLSFYFVTFRLKGLSHKLLFYSGLALMFISGVMAARTSFLGFIAGLALMAKRSPFSTLSLLFVFVIVLMAIYNFFEEVELYLSWVLLFFTEFLDNSSAQHLIGEMYFWPGDNVFFIGSGFVNNGDFAYTDSGYMKDILFGGVFYLLSKLLILFYIIYRFIKVSPLLAFLIFIVVIVFNFKGQFLFNNSTGMAVLYSVFFALVSFHNIRNKV